MIHTIVPLHAALKPLLTRVYNDAIFFRHERKHYAKDGELNAWALDLRLALSKGSRLGPVVDEIIAILEREKITQIVGKGYGSFFLVGAIVGKKPGMRAALVREASKEHGFREQIEGHLHPRLRTAVIDDLVCSGESLKSTLKILKQKKVKVWGAVAVLRFGGPPIKGLPKNFEVVSLGDLYYK